ncbi:MAG: TlpA disulfide reductase family protein [Deltaproteobacteria bacterium]
MHRSLFVVAFLGLLIVAGGNVTVPDRVAAAGSPSGADFRLFRNLPCANDFEMQTADGTSICLSDLRGKVVLLNFWRRHCHYCALEKGYLRTMVKRMDNPDLKVVCADLWDSPSWVKRYAKRNGRDLIFAACQKSGRCVMKNVVRGRNMGYYVVNNGKEAVYEVKGFPTTYVIDKNGRVVATHLGLVRWDSPSVMKWIAGLLNQEKKVEPVTEAEYQLPDWLDRLLTMRVHQAAEQRSVPERPRQFGLLEEVSLPRSARKAPDRVDRK